MAKVNGPFMSLDASGTVAGVLTASKWKGRNYMRIKTNPANPKTPAQLAVRSILGTLSKAAVAVLKPAEDSNNLGSEFYIKARDMAPSGQSWISWLQKALNPRFGGLVTAFSSVGATEKGYYEAAATDLGLTKYVDVSEKTHTGGEQLYFLAFFAVNSLGYTGFASGIDDASEVEVGNFADFVGKTSL